MVNIPKGDKPTRTGTWWPLGHKDGRSASFCCPRCGLLGTLVDHTISDTGAVSPSVSCPNERCDFHDYICLENWPR